ncbi:unnamed protein product [Spirodela intermedia]|uniref:Uncharacterized protein n=1 Tax=Spirodela intermedia TaxID=51605 RepID=A0ABN7EB69_SPIIN|nr:unnamed protein product [Spirodela intermedia]
MTRSGEALWITQRRRRQERECLLGELREKLRYVPTPERWTEARRISLMYNEIRLLPEEPRCPICRRLLLNDNEHHLEEIPVGFSSSSPSLRSPPEIGSLVELRYLNLSWDSLESLPMEVSNLTKLRQLHLEDTNLLKSIHARRSHSLERLQSLNIYGSNYEFRAGGEGVQLCLKDLEDGMWNLTELTLEVVLNSQRLSASIRFLIMKTEKALRFELREIRRVLDPSSKSWSLQHQTISRRLEELALDTLPRATISWKDGNVFVRGPTTVAISKTFGIACSRIEEVIVVEEVTVDNVDYQNDSFFLIKVIWLYDLPNLRSICSIRCCFLPWRNRSSQLSRAEEAALWLKLQITWLSLNHEGRGGGSDGVIDHEGRQFCLKDLEDGMWNLTELDITWIRQLPCIETLELTGCSRIEEVIVVEEVTVDNVDYENDSFFPRLKRIFLEDLPNLSICRHPFCFSCLEDIKVINCPELKKLPFVSLLPRTSMHLW